MNLIKLTLTSFLLTSLIACGGGSPDKKTETPSLGDEPAVGGGTTDDGAIDGGTGGADLIENIRFGSGSGADFKNKSINFENGYSLLGTQQPITVSVIDPNNDNSIVAQNYTYKFSSACAAETPPKSSFLVDTITNASGTAKVYYTNESCLADTITVSLINPDGTEKAQIVSSVEVSVPKLGSGSGSGFVEGKISGKVSLVGTTSTILSLDAVDRHISVINEKISSDDGKDYIVKWTSACTNSTFTPASQILTSDIETTYNANGCTTDTVTASLYTQKDKVNPIHAANVSISIGSEAAIVETPKLGAGIGANFKAGELSLAAEYVLVGSRLDFTVNAVDTGASNALTKNNYQYKFESSCAANASFASEVVASSTGQLANTYFNHNCSAANTLTVRLFAADADTSDNSLAISAATATIKAELPTLGTGNGASFLEGKISGETNLVEVKSTELAINLVDTNDLNDINKLITSSDYLINWTSTCLQGKFNAPKQSLSKSLAKTRYDAGTCATDHTVTATLRPVKNPAVAIGVAATVDIFRESSNASETPVLGTGNGSNFDAGKLSLTADYVLAGNSVAITVNGVNSDDNNSLLNTKYLYKFESNCPSNTVSFSSNVIANNNGTVVNTYFNRTCDIVDEITVRLFAANADTSNNSLAVSTASAQLKTGLPKLGNKSGVDFINNAFEGNLNLVDEASTKLKATAVDPLNSNAVLNSADYYVEWSSTCPTASFSIVTNNLSSAIETRYDGDAQACTTDTVTLTLYNKLDEVLDTLTGDITISASLVPAKPALGTGVAAGFTVGELQFSETSLAARQTIGVSVNIVDITGNANTLITDTEYAVVFSSACVTGGDASFDNTQIRTTSGTATAFYTASGCKEQDTINAALYAVEDNTVNTTTSLAIAKGDLTIELPESNSIEYQSMTARKIAMQNISFSELPETTTVSFIVKDEFNEPMKGKQVAFSLSNKSVGASLSGGTSGSIQGEGEVLASTNAKGVVTITVKSGTTHGLVTVLAVAEKNDGTLLRTQSFGISITTGIPVQTSFSLVLDNQNPRAWNYFEEDVVTATVFLADRFQNPVPDGTIVNFLADGGSIKPTCETSNGSCSVNWTAANPRPGFNKDNSAKQQSKTTLEHPTNDPNSQLFGAGPGVDVNPAWNGGRSGLVTILAYLDGEVNYADSNGNGRFDDGEDYTPMAEAFLDANEDGVYTASDENNPYEQLIEKEANGIRDPAPTIYQGSTCTETARGLGHCASLVHIRREARLVMASDNVGFKIDSIVGGKTADLSAATCINVFNEESVTFNFLVHDYNGNTPINGTALTLEAEGFEVEAVPTAIGNSALTEPVLVPVTIRRDDTFEDLKGFVRLTAAHPVDGIAGSIKSVPVTDDPRIKIKTTDYVIDISSGAQTQVVTFTFEDACGNPPSANDIFIFEVTNMSQSSSAGSADRFQVNGSDLTAGGAYSLTLSNPVTGSGDGEIKIRAINVSAGGLETNRTLPVTVE